METKATHLEENRRNGFVYALGQTYDGLITVDTPNGKSKMKLSHVALVPTFFTNIIALSRATNNDIHFNSGWNLLYCLATGETVCYAK